MPKRVLDTSLLNTQHYKVHIKGKVEQFRERSCALPYTLVLCCITVIQLYAYIYTCGNIINNNDEWTQFLKKIYLSHFILKRVTKGLCVRGELEMEQTTTYWPQVPLTIAALLSYSAGLLNRGSLRATSPLSGAGSHYLELQLQLTPTNSSRLWHPVI